MKLEDVDGRILHRRIRRIQIRMVEGRKTNCGFKSMVDIIKVANGLIGMVKYTAELSGRKYAIRKKGWKPMIVSKLMYRCGALALYQHECEDLEVI